MGNFYLQPKTQEFYIATMSEHKIHTDNVYNAVLYIVSVLALLQCKIPDFRLQIDVTQHLLRAQSLRFKVFGGQPFLKQLYIYCIYIEDSLGLGGESLCRRSLFALCIANCSQFEHSCDSKMQSFLTMCNRTSCAQVQELPQSHLVRPGGHIVIHFVYIYAL